jgi:hypothetical protein
MNSVGSEYHSCSYVPAPRHLRAPTGMGRGRDGQTPHACVRVTLTASCCKSTLLNFPFYG